jgi:hypothetical protein
MSPSRFIKFRDRREIFYYILCYLLFFEIEGVYSRGIPYCGTFVLPSGWGLQ